MLTQNPAIIFNEERHTYKVDGCLVPSVTSLIRKIKPSFDVETISERVAKRDGKTKKQVLDEWAALSEAATTKGKLLHRLAECSLKFPEAMDNIKMTTPEEAQWAWWWSGAKKNLVPVAAEHVLWDEEFDAAGTLDAAFLSKKTTQHHVFDWKTGKNFRKDNVYGEMLLEPFEDLPNCEFITYSLQVSIYRLMLERQDLPCGDSWLMHVEADKITPHKALDLRERATDWLLSI